MTLKLQKKLVLASGSPRRFDILKSAGYTFSVISKPVDESFPSSLPIEEVAEMLAVRKAKAIDEKDSLVLCADTVVIVENEVLNKPGDAQEAFEMLEKLNGKCHKVITGVALKNGKEIHSCSDETLVYFKTMTKQEITYYIDTYKPFDKAGAYGIQEFLGMVGIEKLEGSFYTVMGLPIHLVYELTKPYMLLDEMLVHGNA